MKKAFRSGLLCRHGCSQFAGPGHCVGDVYELEAQGIYSLLLKAPRTESPRGYYTYRERRALLHAPSTSDAPLHRYTRGFGLLHTLTLTLTLTPHTPHTQVADDRHLRLLYLLARPQHHPKDGAAGCDRRALGHHRCAHTRVKARPHAGRAM